jgi:galactokinase
MNAFIQIYGNSPTVLASAAGRVNLMGEHTDYNGGFVLPTTIPQNTQIALRPRDDLRVRAYSTHWAARDGLREYSLGEEQRNGTWLDYIQGVTKTLEKEGFKIEGFDASIHSTVPLGAGLSSSAALEVSLLRALRESFHLALNDLDIARMSQRVENDFVGARVGIMDPMASSLGTPGSALFVDTLTLEYRNVHLPTQMDLLVIHSGITHQNVDQHSANSYNTRRCECEEACRLLGIKELRELRELRQSDLSQIKELPDLLARRVRHVVTENERVFAALEALESAELKTLGQIFNESHASMRADYEVSLPEIDFLVELAYSEPTIYGARLTGGGFGGSIVALAEHNTGRAAAEKIIGSYLEHTGIHASLLVPNPD